MFLDTGQAVVWIDKAGVRGEDLLKRVEKAALGTSHFYLARLILQTPSE